MALESSVGSATDGSKDLLREAIFLPLLRLLAEGVLGVRGVRGVLGPSFELRLLALDALGLRPFLVEELRLVRVLGVFNEPSCMVDRRKFEVGLLRGVLGDLGESVCLKELRLLEASSMPFRCRDLLLSRFLDTSLIEPSFTSVTEDLRLFL